MNRIILIGNGFDLAHGLKTSYKEFINDFWEEKKKTVILKLVRTNINSPFLYEDDNIKVISPRRFSEIREIDFSYNGLSFFEQLNRLKFNELINNTFTYLEVKFENSFLLEITHQNKLKNWVDIEYEYYKALKRCYKKDRPGGISKLNKEFSLLRIALHDYLVKQIEKGVTTTNNIEEKLTSIINPFVAGIPFSQNDDNQILIVNFNYTNTEEHYLKMPIIKAKQDKITCVHIHGELNNPDNKMIFGYGDELDEDYKLIENLNEDDFLENVKSISYLDNDNYDKIFSFIDTSDYEIFIMGHSCGISDRTLLNTLFEHKYCRSIKIFFHNRGDDDNFSEIARNISRNFNNKQLMRNIIVKKTLCEPL